MLVRAGTRRREEVRPGCSSSTHQVLAGEHSASSQASDSLSVKLKPRQCHGIGRRRGKAQFGQCAPHDAMSRGHPAAGARVRIHSRKPLRGSPAPQRGRERNKGTPKSRQGSRSHCLDFPLLSSQGERFLSFPLYLSPITKTNPRWRKNPNWVPLPSFYSILFKTQGRICLLQKP